MLEFWKRPTKATRAHHRTQWRWTLFGIVLSFLFICVLLFGLMRDDPDLLWLLFFLVPLMIFLVRNLRRQTSWLQANKHIRERVLFEIDEGCVRLIEPEDALAYWIFVREEGERNQQARSILQIPISLQNSEEFLLYDEYLRALGQRYCFGLFHQKRLVGQVQLDVESPNNYCVTLSYHIHQEFEGRGWVTRTCEMILSQLMEVGVQRIQIIASPENTRSIAVARRLGFELEGLKRLGAHDGHQAFDVQLFSKIQESSHT